MKNKKLYLFNCGLLVGLTTLSIALGSIPNGRITDDTVIYQNLSEIRVAKEAAPDFDSDVARLSNLEGRYREQLPSLANNPRLVGPMKRISTQKYRYGGSRRSVTRN